MAQCTVMFALIILTIASSVTICLFAEWRLDFNASLSYATWAIAANIVFNLLFYCIYAVGSFGIFKSICCRIVCCWYRKKHSFIILKTSVASQPLHIKFIYHLEKLTYLWLYSYVLSGFIISFGLFMWLYTIHNGVSDLMQINVDIPDKTSGVVNPDMGSILYLVLIIPSFYPFVILCRLWKAFIPIITPKISQINHDIRHSYNNYDEDQFAFMFKAFGTVIRDISYILFVSKLYSIITFCLLPLPTYINVTIIYTFIKPHLSSHAQTTLITIMSIINVCLFICSIFCVFSLWFKAQKLSNILAKYFKKYDNFKMDRDGHTRRNSFVESIHPQDKSIPLIENNEIIIHDQYFECVSSDNDGNNQPSDVHVQSLVSLQIGMLDNTSVSSTFCADVRVVTWRCMICIWRKISGCCKYIGKYCKRYSFCVQNFLLIASCLTTCICVGIEINKLLYTHALKTATDIAIVWTVIGFIICIGSCGVCTSVMTVTMEYLKRDKIKKWYSSDRNFRGMCFIKTILFQFKQPLIWYFGHSIWSYVFQILSFLTLITIAYLTFHNKFTKLRLLPVRYPKLLMFSYVISYIITNSCCTLLVIIGIIFAHNDADIFAHYQYVNWFNIVYLPFLWLYCSKLLNNEMVRLVNLMCKPKHLKYQIISNRSEDIFKCTSVSLQIQSCLGNVYHFAFQIIFQCVVCIVAYVFLLMRIIPYETEWINMCVFYYLQLCFACVMFVNSICTVVAIQFRT
eukprot:249626_1